MLRLILGRSGSGKTEYFRRCLKRMARRGDRNLFLIVPEQSSFENERAMLRLLGEKDARSVFVTSFSRLSDEVLRRYGGFAGRRLDDGGRNIFMSLALEQVADSLEIYRKSAKSAELISMMLTASAEFKMCAVSPLELGRAADELPQGTLRRKTKEISLILSAYDSLVSQSYIDPLDDLTRLSGALKEHSFFQGAVVMIDSFQSFTVQEYKIVEQIVSQAKEVEVALCADRLGDPEYGVGLFSLVRRTASNLISIANRCHVGVAAPAVLKSGRRFENSALAALEGGVYRPAHGAFSGKPDGVAVYEAKDSYDEASFVCATIRRLVIEEGYRYRDFAVIARTAEYCRGALDSELDRWEIPRFMDEPEEIDAEPLMRLLLSAFQIVQNNYSSDDIFLYLKSGLAGFTTERISRLENYTFVWNLSGKKWKEEWMDHPEGFSDRFSERDTALLAEINRDRSAVIAPLEHLARRTTDADGTTMAEAAYRFLEEIHAAEHLREFSGRLSQGGNPALAERELRVWDLLMNILDQTALVIGKNRVTRARYAELLRLVIQTSSIASIPQGLDEVTVGAANRIRAASPKVVFLVGAAQGVFPMTPGMGGILSDGERRELIRLGLPLNDTAEGVAVQERFLVYSALSAASQKLYLSYPLSDGAGKANSPSSLPLEVRSVLPDVPVLSELSLPEEYFASAKRPAFTLTARKWNSNDSVSATLKELLSERESSESLAAVERASRKIPARFQNAASARSLFGDDLRVSATQIETFHLCRFQYFCRYGLDVRERRQAELNALEYGSLMHFLLQKMFSSYGSDAILQMDRKQLETLLTEILNSYVESRLGGRENRTQRFSYLVSRVAASAVAVILHIAEELSQSEFHPTDFELEIGGSVGPLVIPLPDGGEVRVDGKIDRVDLMEKDGVRYVRIVDYKTGKKEFRLSDLVYGMNMQMLVYLAALCENGSKRYGEISPAGVLYMPANRPSVSALRGAPPKELKREYEKQLRMDGLVVSNPAVISGMEKEGKGVYLPVALKDGVPSGKEHLASETELAQILSYLRGLISDMAEELHSGGIEAVPLSGGYEACEWCPYASVCGHESDDPVRPMQKWDRDAAVAELSRKKGEEQS